MLYRILASSLLIMALAACGAPDAPPGTLDIVSVSPADSADDVTPAATVNVTFDRAVDAATLEGRFTLTLAGQPVAGTVSYVRATRTARFTPEAPLAQGNYTASLASGIRGEDGNRLASDQTWSFTVVTPTNGGPNDGPGDQNGDPDPSDPPPEGAQALRVAFLSPTPNERTAGYVDVVADLEAPAGIRRAELFVEGEGGAVRVHRIDKNPQATPTLRETLRTSISTLAFETGEYTLTIELEDLAGETVESSLSIEFLPPFLIRTPVDEDGVGNGNSRQIVAVTIGVNGTIRDDYDVTRLDLFINGRLYAADVPIDDDAASTRLAIYAWDTTVIGPGHPNDASGDRMLTARVTFVDPATAQARSEFTPGVLVDFQP